MKIAVVYTTSPKELVDLIEKEIRTTIGENINILNFYKPEVLEETRKVGYVTPSAAANLICAYMEAVKEGADAILNVCSSVGEVADSVQQIASYINVPIVRSDTEMCREAVRKGKRIAILATLSTTLEPTRNTIYHMARELGRNVETVDVLVNGAFGLEREQFVALLLEKAKQVKEKADVILLAQGSMAYVAEQIQEETGVLTLSSPKFGILELQQAINKKSLAKS